MAGNVILTAKLDFWVKNHKNVLFIGKHGVGKTAMIKDAFERHKLNYRYFSASTMDPWVDFVGVPREKTDKKIPEQFDIIRELASIDIALAHEWVATNWKLNGDSTKQIVDHAIHRVEGLTYLDLVRPQSFAAGEVEALFFDEFNRSPKKVRNAVMELIQFKSINGFKFPNLKIIWAAINPDDDEYETYDVEKLDPAQSDRFHIKVEVPYEPNKDWFRETYGQKIADSAIQWWEELSEEHKLLVSPRRLQYALDIHRERGDMRDVLPIVTNVSKLANAINTGPITEKLETLMRSKDASEARSFLSNENNYHSAMKHIVKSETLMKYFIPLLSKEKLGSIMADEDRLCNFIIDNSDKVDVFQEICKSILDANTNAKITKKIRKALQENDTLSTAFRNNAPLKPTEAHFNKAKPNEVAGWGAVLAELTSAPKLHFSERLAIYDKIVNTIPETMSADEALTCLELLNNLFGETINSSTLTAKPFDKLMGIINHSIAELHRNTNMDWTTIVKKHGLRFKRLLEKIKLSGLSPRLYMPSSEAVV